MPNPSWAQLQALFEQAVALAEAERDAFLTEACGDDAGLRTEIEALLRADAENTDVGSGSSLLRSGDHSDAALAGTTIDAAKSNSHTSKLDGVFMFLACISKEVVFVHLAAVPSSGRWRCG